ncbi:MAG TPA: hypothetical protein DCG54_10490 [Anaerolineae bacterium]|nr:hypothetical protein [Anaerolineae bacterium]
MKTYSEHCLRLISVLLVLGLCLNGSSSAQASSARTGQDFEAFFDAVLAEQLAREHIAGATVAVVQNGELAFAKGYGFADVDASLPVQADRTLFFIGSDGKLFTWTAVMQLVEQGKLELQADINTYLDFEIPTAFGQPITMHHLLTHTAGFEDEAHSLFVENESDLLPLREHLTRYQPVRVYPPGEVMAYSNYGSALAGYIVERVSGQPFASYLTEHILQPLGMNHSFVGNHLPPELAADLSQGYRYQNGRFDSLDFEWTAAIPCAPIRTSAADLGRFMLAHLNEGCVAGNCILRPETVSQMQSLQFNHSQQTDGMAYGIMRMRFNNQIVLWHTGRSPRFVTVLALLPEQNLGLFVSYNTPPADDGRAILFRFLDTFFPVERAPLAEMPLPDWQQRAELFNGNYVPARSNHTTPEIFSRYAKSTEIQIESGRLAFNGWEFAETEPGVFNQVSGDRLLTFKVDENGRRWFFVGILAFFQVPWYETPGFLLAVVGSSLLLCLSFLFAWLFCRKQVSAPGPFETGLSLGLGLFNLVLFAWLSLSFLQYGSTFVYPQPSVDLISKLYWLSLPWTLMLLVITLRVWLRNSWTIGWRVHYSLLTVSALMFLWLIINLNLFG